jgi:hypothetical protein
MMLTSMRALPYLIAFILLPAQVTPAVDEDFSTHGTF